MKKSFNWNVKTLVYLSLLLAMNLVLLRVFSINLGIVRISFGSVSTILAGLWFGPIAGGILGFTGDLLGCLIQGYAPNPLISIAAVLWGVIPVLMRNQIAKAVRFKVKWFWLTIGIVIASIFSTVIFTTLGLAFIYSANRNFGAVLIGLLPARLVLFAASSVAYTLITGLLYFSPLTGFLKSNIRDNQSEIKAGHKF